MLLNKYHVLNQCAFLFCNGDTSNNAALHGAVSHTLHSLPRSARQYLAPRVTGTGARCWAAATAHGGGGSVGDESPPYDLLDPGSE